MTLCIVAKRDRHAFEVLPRRWVVARTFAWISRHRRTVRDHEHLPASHEAMILWAMTAPYGPPPGSDHRITRRSPRCAGRIRDHPASVESPSDEDSRGKRSYPRYSFWGFGRDASYRRLGGLWQRTELLR